MFSSDFSKISKNTFLDDNFCIYFWTQFFGKSLEAKVQKIAKIAIIHVKESNHDKIEGRLHVSK